MAKLIQNIAAVVFIISVVFLTLIAVLSIWDVFENDILWKSLSTIGVLAFASLVVIVAARAIESRSSGGGGIPQGPGGMGA